jgi:hypothetical protein
MMDLRAHLKSKYPTEFRDGARTAFLGKGDGPAREKGDYPLGFDDWPLERRNAWYAGFNVGLCDRAFLKKAGGARG